MVVGKTKTIAVVDDHPVMRMGVKSILECMKFETKVDVLVCSSVAEMEVLLPESEVSLIILDLNIPPYDGIDSLKYVLGITDIPILVYSLHDELVSGPSCLRAGAQAFVMKDADSSQLELAVRAVLDGGAWCSAELAVCIAQGKGNVVNLSSRELCVYENMGRGKSVKEIAYELGVSPKTVESHRERIRAKLHVGSSVDLVVHATKWLNGV